MSKRNYTVDEWRAEGRRLFGDDILQWRFKCPKCGNIATIQEFKDAGAKRADDAAKNCIGRFVGDRGCDWAAYGLFDICTVHVDGIPVFEFAPPETKDGGTHTEAGRGKTQAEGAHLCLEHLRRNGAENGAAQDNERGAAPNPEGREGGAA